jgi:hypothetical protein
MSTSAESTQTQNALLPVEPQPTPVIIKIGSEGGAVAPGDDASSVSIFSPMPFSDSTGETWEEAVSTYTGRIAWVSIWDRHKTPVDIHVPQSEEPASLTIHFGENTQIVLGEEGPLGTKDIHLDIESGQSPFTIERPGTGAGWTTSVGSFLGRATRVVVMQGQTVLRDVSLEFPDVIIYPTFDRF